MSGGILAQWGVAAEAATTPAISSVVPFSGTPNGFTLTFASAHGRAAGDAITLAGFTPSQYNGAWVIASVPTTTTATVWTPTLLSGNSSVQGTYSASAY